jgi:hypothetical protein
MKLRFSYPLLAVVVALTGCGRPEKSEPRPLPRGTPTPAALASASPVAVKRVEEPPSEEAADIYMRGFVLATTAEKLAADGDTGGAVLRYKKARVIFDELHEQHPEFQLAVLEWRRKKIGEQLAGLDGSGKRRMPRNWRKA